MPCLLHHLQNFYLMKLHIIEISKDHSLLAHEDYVLHSSSRCVKLNFFSNLSWVFYSTTKKATNKGEKTLTPNVVIEILYHHCWYQYKCCPSEVIQNNHFQKQYINFFWTFCKNGYCTKLRRWYLITPVVATFHYRLSGNQK